MSITTKILNMIGLEKKSAPDFGQLNPHTDFFSRGWRFQRFHQEIDYHNEVGSLDTHSLVMCVVNYTGTRLPEAKPSIKRRDKAGDLQPEDGHPLAQLIRRPNPHHVWGNYCLALSMSWWIAGNVYFLKVRDLSGKVVELWYLPHFMVEPRWPNDGRSPAVPFDDTTDTFLSHYQYIIPGKAPVLYPASEIVHIKRGVNLGNARSGLSAFEPLVKELYGDHKMAQFTAQIMANMGIAVPLLSPKNPNDTISTTDAEAIKAQYIEGTTGRNAGKPMVNTIALDIAKFGFSPTELDLSKLRLIPESRVAAVTGIPAATLQLMVGLQNGTSYASSQQARQQGYEEVVEPMQRSIAEELNWQLVPEFEKSANVEFSFDTSKVRVLQTDGDSLMKRAATGYLAGVIMRSDARKSLGLDWTPDDDVFFQPRSSGVIKEGEDPEATGTLVTSAPIKTPAKGFASVADIDRYLGILEKEMKDFTVDK